MRRVLRSFILIINYKTLAVTALSLLSTYVCVQEHWYADFPVILVSVAIVFPVVFSIDAAYKRRESALEHLSNLKAHGIAIYYAMRDWPNEPSADLTGRVKALMEELMVAIRTMFLQEDNHGDKIAEIDKQVYHCFSQLSHYVGEMRSLGVQSGEISRVNQYISKMMLAFDNVKSIYQYRTPITLRAYSKVFINVFPIIYGPYFANTFNQYSHQLVYVMPILYSFILVSLDNIQDHLEHPFDEIGEDDIRIDPKGTTELME